METIGRNYWAVISLLVGVLISTEISGVYGQSGGEHDDVFGDTFRLACILLLVLVFVLIAVIILVRFYCVNYYAGSPYKKVKTTPEDPEEPTELVEIDSSSTDESIVKQPLYDYTPIAEVPPVSVVPRRPPGMVELPRYSQVGGSLPRYSTLDHVAHKPKTTPPTGNLSPVEEPIKEPLTEEGENNTTPAGSNGSPPPPYDTGSNPMSDEDRHENSPLSSPTHSAELLSTGAASTADNLSETDIPSRHDDISSDSDNLAVDDRVNATPSPSPLEEELVQNNPDPLEEQPIENEPSREAPPLREIPIIAAPTIPVEDQAEPEVHLEDCHSESSEFVMPEPDHHSSDSESDLETPVGVVPTVEVVEPTENPDVAPVEDAEPVYVGPTRRDSCSSSNSDGSSPLITPGANEIPPAYDELTPAVDAGTGDPFFTSTPAVVADSQEPPLEAPPRRLMRPESYEPRVVDEPDGPTTELNDDDIAAMLAAQPEDGFDYPDGIPADNVTVVKPRDGSDEEDTLDGVGGEDPDGAVDDDVIAIEGDEPGETLHSVPLEAVVTIENHPEMDESTESMDLNYSNATTIPRDRRF